MYVNVCIFISYIECLLHAGHLLYVRCSAERIERNGSNPATTIVVVVVVGHQEGQNWCVYVREGERDRQSRKQHLCWQMSEDTSAKAVRKEESAPFTGLQVRSPENFFKGAAFPLTLNE